MGISWSAMRNVLEKKNICDPLKGRVQYFATSYRKAHDETGRVSARLDGNEVFKSHWEYWYGIHEETKNHGGFDGMVFMMRFKNIIIKA